MQNDSKCVLTMKKFFGKHKRIVFVAASAICLTAVFVLLGVFADRTPEQIPNNSQQFATVYIDGAVLQSGYYMLPVGSSYVYAIGKAGLHPNGVLPQNPNEFVKTKTVTVSFFDGEKTCYSVNVNGVFVTTESGAEGLNDVAVKRLADYIRTHGKIRNRVQMQLALGDLYQSEYYKFFVAEEDYEPSN